MNKTGQMPDLPEGWKPGDPLGYHFHLEGHNAILVMDSDCGDRSHYITLEKDPRSQPPPAR